jgi:hypothetical protein
MDMFCNCLLKTAYVSSLTHFLDIIVCRSCCKRIRIVEKPGCMLEVYTKMQQSHNWIEPDYKTE